MDHDKQIEQLVLTCLDTAKGMLKEYEMVVPFGIRSFSDSEDLKMNCPADKNPQAEWAEQISLVVSELKDFIKTENIFATVLVTELSTGDENGVGLQVETEVSSVLFVYPYRREGEEWIIDEPIHTDQLLETVF